MRPDNLCVVIKLDTTLRFTDNIMLKSEIINTSSSLKIKKKINNPKKIDIFLVFAQNIDCGYKYPQSTCTHNLCFGEKIK